LDANESPFPVPSKIRKLVIKEASFLSFNRYPDPSAAELKKAISKKLNTPVNSILLGNGSDEIISYIISAFGNSGGKVLFPVPTFAMYKIISISHGQKPVEIPLTKEFDIDIRAFKKKLSAKGTKIIFLSYPNNPTGKCFSGKAIFEILKDSSSIVVIDEAYSDFSDRSFLSHIKKYKNLIILKTLSKIGMSSLRIGMALANRDVIETLEKVRLPYNLNSFTQAAAKIFLDNFSLLNKQIRTTIAERDFLFMEMKKNNGILPYPSDANFILFKTKNDNSTVYNKLIKEDIAVRCFTGNQSLNNCLRVTVGTPEENRKFLTALKKVINKKSGE